MNRTLIPRLQEFAEQSRPEWQIVLMNEGNTDLTITRQDLLDLLKLAQPEDSDLEMDAQDHADYESTCYYCGSDQIETGDHDEDGFLWWSCWNCYRESEE